MKTTMDIIRNAMTVQWYKVKYTPLYAMQYEHSKSDESLVNLANVIALNICKYHAQKEGYNPNGIATKRYYDLVSGEDTTPVNECVCIILETMEKYGTIAGKVQFLHSGKTVYPVGEFYDDCIPNNCDLLEMRGYELVKRRLSAEMRTPSIIRNAYAYEQRGETFKNGESVPMYARMHKYYDESVSRDAELLDTFINSLCLTPRQKDIAKLRLQGYGDKTIAKKLCIDVSTVKGHKKAIFAKVVKSGMYNDFIIHWKELKTEKK